MDGRELAVRAAGILFVLEFNPETSLGEAAYDKHLIERALELVTIAQPLEKAVGQFGIVGAKIQVIGETEVCLDGTGHGAGVDLARLPADEPLLEVANLTIPAHNGVPTYHILGQLGVAPCGGQDDLNVIEQKVRKGTPRFRPSDVLADGYDAVPMAFKRYDGTAKALHKSASMFARVSAPHF